MPHPRYLLLGTVLVAPAGLGGLGPYLNEVVGDVLDLVGESEVR